MSSTKPQYKTRRIVESEINYFILAMEWPELADLYMYLGLAKACEPEEMLRIDTPPQPQPEATDQPAPQYSEEKIAELKKEMDAELTRTVATGTDGEDDFNIDIKT